METTRRHFFSRAATGIGIAALGSLLAEDGYAATGGLPGLPHFAPKAKRVVFLHQSGGPSQMDLFDYKPTLDKLAGTELPGSVAADVPARWSRAGSAGDRKLSRPRSERDSDDLLQHEVADQRRCGYG